MGDQGVHIPVLLKEAVEVLDIKSEGVYLDATFGRGGHSQYILSQLGEKGKLFAVDKDPLAIQVAKEKMSEEPRFRIFHSDFSGFIDVASEHGLLETFDGILLDLGVSSPQLDNAERGFSFSNDGPLDMRMNTESGVSAADWIKHTELGEMIRVFKSYGEERYSPRIARAIVRAREEQDIVTTLQLAEIVKVAHPKWERGKHPATRVFQAIRIEINGELDSLKIFLLNAAKLLKVGGYLSVISFHSLEDRLVKRFIRDGLKEPSPLRNLPVIAENAHVFKSVSKPIYPSEAEVDENVRSRSSVLRVAKRWC